MPLDLDRLQQRIVGVLLEKERTVPDAYPLTVNALVTGCNQKSNREPQMSVEPYEVEGALRALMDEGWVREVDAAGGRTMRYEHRAGDQLGVEPIDLAILAELLLRGPQTPQELKTRASRMHPVDAPTTALARLEGLAARPVPFVELLPHRPRERYQRWRHRLGREAAEESPAESHAGLDAPVADDPPVAPATPEMPEMPAMPASSPDADRLEILELRVAELEERLDRLEGR